MTRSGNIVGSLFLLVFVGFWSAITFGADYVWLRSVATQVRAQSWSVTDGRVRQSSVTTSRRSKGGTNYQPVVRYAYRVGGREHQGDRIRAKAMTGAGKREAYALVAAMPPGSTVKVWYDPRDPSEAMLRPGVQGADLFVPLFLTPFNLIALAGCAAIGMWIWSRLAGPREAGVGVRRELRTVRVRLPRFSPITAALAAAGASAFVLTFAVGLTGGSNPPFPLIGGAWAVVLLLAGVAYARTAAPIRAGLADLIVDYTGRALTLPRTHGRRERLTVPFARACSVVVNVREHRNSKGRVTREYLPTLRFRSERGNRQAAVLARWLDEERARQLAEWLAVQVRVPGPGAGERR